MAVKIGTPRSGVLGQRPTNGFDQFVPLSYTHNQPQHDATVKSSTLCTRCQTLASGIEVLYKADRGDGSFKHYDTGAQLRQSSMNGCHFCTLIWQSIQDKDPLSTECPKNGSRKQVNTLVTQPGDAGLITINFYGGDCLWVTARLSDKASLRGNLDLVRCQSIPRLQGLHTSSCHSWDRAVSWLTECLHTHELCRQKTSAASFYPTRLIDVGDGQKPNTVKLILSSVDNVAGEYVALNYCWGSSTVLTLTSATLATFRKGICTDQLPQTIQDAILITRRLKVRYLWVDSLCVIQDSLQDWCKEALSMSDVYQHCLLTVAALGATDSSKGLFSKRDPLALLPCELFSMTNKELIGVRSWRTATSDPVPAFAQSPLHGRGWVVQEHILSSRTMSFGVSLFYDCRMGIHHEWETSLARDRWCTVERLEDATFKTQVWEWISRCLLPNWDTEENRADFWALWVRILALYTKSALTKSDDRSIALRGVIETIKSATGWKYTSGIWHPFKVESLVWRIASESRVAVSWSPAAVPLTPTWSWEHSTIPIHGQYGKPPADFTRSESLVEVVEINDSIPSHQYIVIKGDLMAVTKFSPKSNTGFFGRESQMALESGGMRDELEKTYLDSNSHNAGDVLYYLPLLVTFTAGLVFQDIHGLLLTKSPVDPDAYVRVGLAICLRETSRSVCQDWAASSTSTYIKIF